MEISLDLSSHSEVLSTPKNLCDRDFLDVVISVDLLDAVQGFQKLLEIRELRFKVFDLVCAEALPGESVGFLIMKETSVGVSL